MAATEKTMFCHRCQKNVLARRQNLSHVLHLLLAIVTGGLWLVVWLVLGAMNARKPFLCSVCGGPTNELPRRAFRIF